MTRMPSGIEKTTATGWEEKIMIINYGATDRKKMVKVDLPTLPACGRIPDTE